MKNRRLAVHPLALLLGIWAGTLEAQVPPAAAPSPASRSAAAPASAPPKAAARPVSDTYFGRTIADPYRWMEEQDNPELEKWLRAQAKHTRHVLDALPGRSELRQRVLELDKSVARVNGVQSVAGRLFYLKTEPGGEIPRLYVRPADGGDERLLVDPTSRGEEGQHAAIDFFQPSWDGKLVAYGLSSISKSDRLSGSQDAYKFAARLQSLPGQARPVLLRVDFDAGHGMGSTRSQFMEELADQWSFLLWQFGDRAFQPAAIGNGGAVNDVRATTGDPSAAEFPAEALLGTWTFNAQKSDFSAVTLKFREIPGGVIEMWSNGESHEFIADGKDRKALYGYTEAWTRLGPSTWQVVTKLEGRLLGTEVMTVSPDGGTLTRTFNATADTAIKETTTYRRLGRGAGLEGTWQTQTVEGPQDIRFERDGDMLRYLVPRWETVGTARLDGRHYPLTSPGLASGATWSIRKTGKNTFEWTLKHPGDVAWVGTITVSDDGRVLTDHGGPKAGQRMTLVYEKR